jgi:hypothetical protein
MIKMLKAKELKKLLRKLPSDADILIESIIDNDDCLWTTTAKVWVDVDNENNNKSCLVLQPSDIQLSNNDITMSAINGEIQDGIGKLIWLSNSDALLLRSVISDVDCSEEDKEALQRIWEKLVI